MLTRAARVSGGRSVACRQAGRYPDHVLARGVAVYGLTTPISDPIRAVMEVITLLSAVAVAMMVAAIVATASPARGVYGTLALTFTGLLAGTTTLVHVIALTAGRQLGRPTLIWPSDLYAAELAAWDALLGVALVFVALTVETSHRYRAIRIGFWLAGILCLIGLIGPAVGSVALQHIGIAGYAVVLPIVCTLAARAFALHSIHLIRKTPCCGT